MKTSIGIKPEHLAQIAGDLQKILADEYVLYTKTRKAHWNVEGPDFYNVHKFFEDQYGQLEQMIDDVAERIRTLGHFAQATLKDFLAETHLSEVSKYKHDSEGLMNELLADHETIIIKMREMLHDYVDVGTADFISNVIGKHEKMAWILRAHLK